MPLTDVAADIGAYSSACAFMKGSCALLSDGVALICGDRGGNSARPPLASECIGGEEPGR